MPRIELSHALHGYRPSPEHQARIAAVLGTTPEALFDPRRVVITVDLPEPTSELSA